MDVFLIDSWDLNKQDKQIKFLRQAVSVAGEIVPLEKKFLRQSVYFSREIVPLELFYQTSCRLIEGFAPLE